MSAPVTGPHVYYRSNGLDGPGSYRKLAYGYRQAAPYRLELPYDLTNVRTTRATLYPGSGSYGGYADAGTSKGYDTLLGPDMWGRCSYELPLAVNSVAHRLHERVEAASVELGINLAQRQQAIDMIATRGRQLLRKLKSVKTGVYGLIANRKMSFKLQRSPRTSRRGRPPRRRRNPDLEASQLDAANLMLEIQFGWLPLLGSVYNGFKLLQEPLKTVEARASGKRIRIDREDYVRHSVHWDVEKRLVGSVRSTAKAKFFIENPNLYLANRLGIVNPAVVVWDGLPFSFVVDFFANVSQFLNSFTDYMGLGVRDASYSSKFTASSYYRNEEYYPPWGVSFGSEVYMTGVGLSRKTGLPPVKLRLKPFSLNLFHARTVWALVVQRASKL